MDKFVNDVADELQRLSGFDRRRFVQMAKSGGFREITFVLIFEELIRRGEIEAVSTCLRELEDLSDESSER